MTLPTSLRNSRQLVALAAPIAGIQLAQVALTTTDLLMMGLIGVQAIAAGGLAITLYNQIRTMCVGAVTAVSNLVAAAAGRGELRSGTDQLDDQARAEVRAIVRSAFLVATVVGIFAGIVLTALSFALAWFGQDATVLALAQPMMIALAFGLTPMLWLNVLRQFAVGMRRPGSLLWVTIGSVAVNAALDAAFIYGWLGLPVLGVTGIGVATSLVNLLTFGAFYLIVRRDEHLADLLSLRAWQADPATVREILRLGLPISLTYGSEAGIFSVAALIMGSFGPAPLAAHNVVIQLTYIVFQVTIGLSHGSSTLVSRVIGQGNPDEAHQIARTAYTLGGIVMAAVGIVYLVAPRVVLTPFLNPDEAATVLPIAQTLLLIAVVQQVVDCAQNIGVGLLRGLGNTKSGFLITLVGYWAVGLPVLLGCAYLLGLDGPGVWLGLCAGLTVTAVLLHRRFNADLRLLQSSSTSE
ncbi:MATE family efflux transporter [Mycolicibacterium setense]|uniref:Probable multidrug resistance protein NorM n=1 Tax=Mycolicibacterium setense TaxID=431269 RepID=A0ABR4Z158_9MYCO|nr:MATE family efflux transporter [Mycolicibacterium setense]KHO24685.1 multidrug transporter [Mycolicibacterium setense]KHO28178.1 multidrug transporter [Mycolicibacterium setense]MCV7110112.1 MATE family efflux transporter [Mycolicibacterium setense]OBB20760.1 MATE family efflux transporter [Mycolicibacterium setense]